MTKVAKIKRKSRSKSVKPDKLKAVSMTLPRYLKSVRQSNGATAAQSVVESFGCAIDDPFCAASFGAKVPDEFNFPTESSTLKSRCFYQTNATGNGPGVLIVTPLPQVGVMALGQTGAPGSFNAVTGNLTNLQINSVAGNILTVPTVQPLQPAQLAATASSFRVVGWGVRIRNTTKATDVMGDVSVTVLPTCGKLPSAMSAIFNPGNVANPGSSWSELQRWCSLPTTGYSATNGSWGVPLLNNMEALASTEVYTAAELAQTGGILVRPKVHSPGAAYRFRPTGFVVSTTAAIGYDSVVFSTSSGGAGTSPINADASVFDTSGHNAVVIVLPNTSTVNTYEVEVIYHLETVPLLVQGSTLVASSVAASPVAPYQAYWARLQKALSAPFFSWIAREGNSLKGYVEQALPGLMTKAAMLALG